MHASTILFCQHKCRFHSQHRRTSMSISMRSTPIIVFNLPNLQLLNFQIILKVSFVCSSHHPISLFSYNLMQYFDHPKTVAWPIQTQACFTKCWKNKTKIRKHYNLSKTLKVQFMANAMFHSVLVQMGIRVMAVDVMILTSVWMATTTAMKMLHVRTLMEALIALVMMVIKDPAPHVETWMNVNLELMIVMLMPLAIILLDHILVLVTLDMMVMEPNVLLTLYLF